MNSLDVATIFLDSTMSIRKFSPAATRVFNIREGDVGRPLNDLTHNLIGPSELVDEIQQVVQNRQTLRREIQTAGGGWLLMMIAPYKNDQERIKRDVVLSFVDITELKQAQSDLRQEKAQTTALFNLSGAALIECNSMGELLRFSPDAAAILPAGMEQQKPTLDALFSNFLSTDGHPIQPDDLPLEQLQETGTAIRYTRLHLKNAPGSTCFDVTLTPLLSPDGELETILLVFTSC